MENRTVMVAIYFVVAFVGGMALIAMPLLLFPRPWTGWGAIVALTASCLAGVGWATFFAIKAHYRLDEFQRERAKDAVYWGVTVGVAAATPIYSFVVLGGLHRLVPGLAGGRAVAVAFAGGYGLAIVAITIGCCTAAAWLRWGRAATRA